MSFLWLLSGLRTDAFDALFETITRFGEKTLLIVLICIIYWCVNKKMGCEMGFTFCISGLCVQGLKIIFRIPRPWVIDPEFKPVEGAVEAATGYSFPSGHTQSATSVYGTGALNTKKNRLKILFIALFILIGFSRMYLGVHTPKDVLTAWILTLGIAYLVHFSFENENRVKVMLAVIALLCVALFVLGDSLYLNDIVDFEYVTDCCEIIGASLGFLVGYLFEHKYVNFNEKATLKIQAIKLILGLSGVIVLKFGLSALLGEHLLSYVAENFILILFIAYIYPAIFTTVINKTHK